MKRFGIPVVLTLSLIVGFMPASSAAVTPGTKCSKAGSKQTFKGKLFTCIKLGSRLYWNNGVSLKKTPTSTKTATSIQTPTPVTPNARDCDLVPTPQLISNLKAEWMQEDLALTFDWDTKSKTENCRFWPGGTIVPAADIITEFQLTLNSRESFPRTTPYRSFPIDRSLTQQKVILTETLNQETNGVFRVDIADLCIFTINSYYKKSEKVCLEKVPAYVLNLPVPVITVSP